MRALALALALAAGCFGSGPVPGPPPKATVVFTAPLPAGDPCNGNVFIGPVAIGAQAGYAITVPYTPQSCGGAAPASPVEPVLQFAKDGSDPHGTMIGMADTTATFGGGGGASNAPVPRIVVTPSGPVWAAASNISNDIVVDPGGLHTGGGLGGSPVGLLSDGADLYVAGGGAGPSDLDNPNFPCCGTGNQAGGTLTRLPGPVQLPIAPQSCGTTPDCIVQNTQSLFYLVNDTGPSGGVDVDVFPKSGTSAGQAQQLARIGGAPDFDVVMGMAADDTRVVWAASRNFGETGSTPPSCKLFSYDPVAQTMTMPFSTSSFSCMGLALDGGSVYFAIVGSEPLDSDCSGCTEKIHGFGIGRFTFATSTVETIAVGMKGYAAGPRRVYVDGGDVYAIDPLAIGKIAKTALDGAQDVPP